MSADASKLDPGFSDFVYVALNHGIGSLEGGGPLIPFVLAESNGQRDLRRFALERLEESVEAAFAFASDERSGAERVAVAFDGFLTWEGERSDAIYVEAFDQPTSAHVVVAQRYKPKRLISKLGTLGDPVFLDAEAYGKLRRQ